MSGETPDWSDIVGDRVFISDTGADIKTTRNGQTLRLGRYAAWSPRSGGAGGHAVVEVSSDLGALMKKYDVPRDRVLSLAHRGGRPEADNA